jgi:transcriptional regulator with XRE-family HTH domain
MSEHVASKLKLFRQVLGWTQEHLAEAAGLSSRTVQRAENGEEMSGETLQALAAVFDLSVAVLRQPVPSEDEIRKGAEEAQKRYKFIALTKIERASDLQGYMGADAWQVDHVAGLSEEQEDEIAVLEELLRDYGDLWSELEPTHRREALKTIFETIARLTGTGDCCRWMRRDAASYRRIPGAIRHRRVARRRIEGRTAAAVCSP